VRVTTVGNVRERTRKARVRPGLYRPKGERPRDRRRHGNTAAASEIRPQAA